MSARTSTTSPTRRIAAIGAICALVVALVAIGIAVGTAVEGGGGDGAGAGSGSGNDGGAPRAAASVEPKEDAEQKKMYDDLARRVARREDGDPLAVGKKDAPVVLVEYADYQCSFCGRFTRETQPELIKKYVDDGTLRIEFRNFTIYGADSERAARASWAAGRQGKFWQMHDELYAKTRKGNALAEDKLVDLARAAGVGDLERFRTDMNGEDAAAALKRDQEEGYGLGVQATPAFLVNGRPIAGAQPTEVFVRAVADAARTAEDDKKAASDNKSGKDEKKDAKGQESAK